MPKLSLKLIYKKEIIPKVFHLVFSSTQKVEFVAGQFFTFEVAPKTYRSYSVLDNSLNPNLEIDSSLVNESDNYFSFIISTKNGGAGSIKIESLEIGETLLAIGPNGKFRLNPTPKPKVFVATGTGLAPFVPMIKESQSLFPATELKLLFGVWKQSDDFSKLFVQPSSNLEIYTVIDDSTGANLDKFNVPGRVTTAVLEISPSLVDFEFYLCGHPAMVTAMFDLLQTQGVLPENIFMEKFG